MFRTLDQNYSKESNFNSLLNFRDCCNKWHYPIKIPDLSKVCLFKLRTFIWFVRSTVSFPVTRIISRSSPNIVFWCSKNSTYRQNGYSRLLIISRIHLPEVKIRVCLGIENNAVTNPQLVKCRTPLLTRINFDGK